MPKSVSHVHEMVKAIDNLMYERLQRVGALMERKLKQVVSQPGHGRLYKRQVGRSGKYHRASSPNQPPATDSGRLRQVLRFRVDKKNMSVQFGALKAGSRSANALKYVHYLEFGRRRMAPRPFLSTTFSMNKETIRRIMAGRMWAN